MSVMTAQLPLALLPVGAVELSGAAGLVEDAEGGRVYLHGSVVSMWAAGDEVSRRLAAVQLVRIEAATAVAVAAGFGVNRETLRRWEGAVEEGGAVALVPGKRGPKGPSKLTAAMVADIASRRADEATLGEIAGAVGVSITTVRRALAAESSDASEVTSEAVVEETVTGEGDATDAVGGDVGARQAVLPVLGAPVRRGGERALARAGLLGEALPVFTAAARVPMAGLLLAMPALEASGLLACARDVYGRLPAGFYGLDTVLIEAVLRALAGAPRAEGATRLDPVVLGRVLGMDRSPEVKTIRRKIAQLAAAGRGADLQCAMAAHQLRRATDQAGQVGVVLYVDGHVRAYQGTRKIAKTHLSRLRFPAPATVETWVTDSDGGPVLVVMSQPGASLAMELRRLLPQLRQAVGDDRRVLVGFDRGGWSPALFAHMHRAGFDVLTWRKHPAPDLAASQFADHTYTDGTGLSRTWQLADTLIDLPLAATKTTTTSDHGIDDDGNGDGEGGVGVWTDEGGARVLRIRQVSRLDINKGVVRQVHVLTTRTDLTAGEVVYRMGSRWRQENYFRYARMHFDLDSHDTYAHHADDPARSVPNPAKARAHQVVTSTRARYERARARADEALLAARTPRPGQQEVQVTNAEYNAITGPAFEAWDELGAAQEAHRAIPARLPLGEVHPGQQVLDTETKLITHAIKMAAHNTTTDIARDIRLHTHYARAADEAFVLARQALTHSGDIDPRADGILTIRLDPLPTARATAAIAELCHHLTATSTTYPGTDLTLRYEIKNQ